METLAAIAALLPRGWTESDIPRGAGCALAGKRGAGPAAGAWAWRYRKRRPPRVTARLRPSPRHHGQEREEVRHDHDR
ncbi:predicted protein [Streptomyces albidoflavus]|nr:predicted protein [Streptomyces albidoflavus]